MWGGRPDRNMVSDERGLPATWDVAKKTNIRWTAALGSRTFGNPVVSGGKVFIGTNNDARRNPKIDGDKGVLMCFAESDGRFLWQAVHDKFPNPTAHDWPEIGLCSAPCVVGDRVYYTSNRCELVCADAEGFRDGTNDGPLTDEQYAEQTDADFVWILDMHRQLGVVPLYACASAPLVADDIVFVVTGNGASADADGVPAPQAPSFLAVDRHTGKVIWSDNSPGARITSGQWSSPAYGHVNGRPQVVFPGGDGWLYAFEPKTGKPIWKFNCLSHQAAAEEVSDDDRKNSLLATPVYYDNKVFIAIGQAPELGDGPGCLWAVDATKTGDVTRSATVWRLSGKEFGRSVSTVAIRDGLLYTAEVAGYLNCIDVLAGKRLWRHDLKSPVWASPLIADGKVYIPDEDGDVAVLQHGRQARPLAENTMRETTYATVVAAHGTIYVADRSQLYAIAQPHARAASQPATSPATSDDWPMFRGNPALTGRATGDLPSELRVCWKYEAPDAVESSAAIAGGAVYFGCNDGFLYCADLATGAIRWKHKAASAIRSSPCVHGLVVLAGDDDGMLHALDVATGAARWTFAADGQIVSSPNAVGGRVLFGSYDGYLYCVNAADGRLVWKFETEGNVHGTPGVTGEYVLIAGCDERLRVIRLSDGSAAGRVPMGSYSGASAAIRGNLVFVGTFANQVLAIDWTAARIQWTYQPAERQFPFYSSAAIADETIVIGGRDRLVHALDARTGTLRWTFATRGRVDSSPAIAGDRVFVASFDGMLYALDLASGRRLWEFDAGSEISASPAIGEGRLVIGTDDGVVYCFGRKERTP